MALRETATGMLEHHPGAAASLCEGLEETLTLRRLGIDGRLGRTLSSTNFADRRGAWGAGRGRRGRA